MEFPGFLGNEQVKAALSAAFALGRFPHAVVLQGEEGCGKRTLAGILAKALVCRDREHAPCGACPSCIRAAAGSHPDIRTVEGSGTTRSLTVDMVKSVIADAYRMPEEADVNVYLLLMGSHTTEAAQNKLLKIVEEPPEGAVFILVCESAEQLLPTIRSRVQSFTLKPPSLEEAAAYAREHMGLGQEEAERLAALCGGNIGRMLEDGSGGDSARSLEIARAMAAGMMRGSGDELFRAAAPLQKDRKLCRDVLARLTQIFRDAVVIRTSAKGAGQMAALGGAPEEAALLGRLPMKRLCALPEIGESYRQKVDRNGNMPLLVTCLCCELLDGKSV